MARKSSPVDHMGKKLMDILTGAGAMGLFAGLFALTGHDLDPQSVIVACIDFIVGSLRGATGAEAAQLWDQVKIGLVIYGLVGLLIFIGSVMYCGKRGIITAACGYFGVLLLITGLGHGLPSLYLPIALLAIGLAVAKLMSDRGNLKLGR
ncbi:MAG TPA: hypothetical protein VGJ92_09275 [Methanocella sp.]|jgi:hypothetical protein